MNRRGSPRHTPAPAPPEGEFREEMPTYTDPVELEAARVRSSFSQPPPATTPLPPEALRMAAYETLFGGFDRVPSIAVSPEDVAAASLDGRAGMLLGLLDGNTSIRVLLAMGVLEPADTLAVLEALLDRGVIALK
jgi:hypothetical protein